MPKVEDFWLSGESASSHGVILQKEIEFDAPAPVIDTVKVPGRNGDIVYWSGAYGNVSGTASCYCLNRDVATKIREVNAWLLRSADYQRLETLSEPRIFRLARVRHGARLLPRGNVINSFDVEFDCKPQKFLKEGERVITVTGAMTLTNPTPFPALPIIRVTGDARAGTITIGNYTLNLTRSASIELDCETQEATQNGQNVNNLVSGEYPKLKGDSAISFTGGITKLEIIPRWWTL